MLAALMAGQRWEGREAGSRLVAHPQPQGPQPLAVDQPGAPLPISFPLCVSLFSASPSSIPSLRDSLCVPSSLDIFPILTPCLSAPVATVNDLACRGLDKLEEKLPFLQQPSETVTPQHR